MTSDIDTWIDATIRYFTTRGHTYGFARKVVAALKDRHADPLLFGDFDHFAFFEDTDGDLRFSVGPTIEYAIHRAQCFLGRSDVTVFLVDYTQLPGAIVTSHHSPATNPLHLN